MEFFDTHCHLDATQFDDDREAVIERAVSAGVKKMVCVGGADGFHSTEKAIAIAEKYPFIWASAGLHPNVAQAAPDKARLLKLAEHPRVVAIGETGLDNHWKDVEPAQQEIWFRLHIEVALETNKPLIVHAREAGADCLRVLRDTGAKACGGVFHCYAEDAAFAAELREMGFLISFTGSLTFKNATALRIAAAGVPIEQIMLETDAPYLAPQAWRGKRCESAQMIETARVLAETKGLSIEEVARITTETANRFFKIKE